MPNTLPYNQLVEKLIRDNKNVLIIDTCILLDIVRCLNRGRMEIFNSALNIFNDITNNKLNFNIVLPSLVPVEWQNNIDKEVLSASKSIEEQHTSLKNLQTVIRCLGLSIILDFNEFHKAQIEQQLKSISYKIMNVGYVCKIEDEIKKLAIDRVINSSPPSKKDKDSTKDCIIYEEVLRCSELLRKNGFNKKIIFASSNTQEYFYDKNLHPEIIKDFKISNIFFVTSLNWAESEANC